MTTQVKVPRRPLGNTGLEVSVISYGGSPLGGIYDDLDEDEAIRSVHAAFEAGINFFDTSPYYGDKRSELVLGRAIAALPRDQLVLATKVGRYGLTEESFDFSAARVTASVAESLARLQTEYIDLVHCHDIEFGDLEQVVNETLPALLQLKAQGLVRHIGITGLPLKIYTYVLDRAPPGSVDAVLSYCRHSLLDSALLGLVPYLQAKGVGLISASPLSMGLLTPQGPPAWHPATEEVKAAARRAADAAAKHGVSIARLGMAHALQSPEVATVLTGMPSCKQVEENVQTALQALGIIDNPAAEQEAAALAEVKAILAPVQDVTWPSGRLHNN